ncbi:hypothetical protein Csa_006680 [Cucumis sativus]|uniref:Uncharacterized protein n=1 Tax=Cucumis sativus TaxID=3659 RepID=A0A0A0LL18_CUCSA|nr:hypothetical protein Csa_006680 [Cucumis sativus]
MSFYRFHFIVASFFFFLCFSFSLFSPIALPPSLSNLSNKVSTCLRLLLYFLLFPDSLLLIASSRTYYSAIVVSNNEFELMERHHFIDIGRVNCLIRCTTFRVDEAE